MLKSRGKGFTLMELMIVVIIVGILGALALPNYMKTQQKSYAAEAWSNLSLILKGSKAYYADHSALAAPWSTDISYLPIENPNTMSNAKFSYSIATSGSWYIQIYATPTSTARTGTTEYQMACSYCYEANETISRYERPDSSSSWTQVSS